MPEKFHQYYLTETLSKKYSHTTYLASPTNPQRGHGEPESQVVLTVFNASLFRFPHECESLLQKAHRIKQLQHPYLVSMLDVGIEGEQPFVVREYLPNNSLRSGLKKIFPGRLLLRDALNLVSQVGEVLVYAHQHNIIHGNIKPENILLGSKGQAVLADFHLVSRKDAIVRDQASEEYAFCYLAPEQFAGTCDARSDQYALGCVTYELITGRVPFAPQTLTSMMGHPNNGQPAPLSESVADLPPSLEAAVLKTLAQDPEERFFDFSLFLEVIKSVLSPPPAFPLARAARSRKNRAIAHPVRSAQARDVSSPISNRTALSGSMPQPPELSGVSIRAKVEAVEPKHISSTAQASMPESPEMVSLSESLDGALQYHRFPFSLSGQAYSIDTTENEQKIDDSLAHNSFVQEKEKVDNLLVAESFIQEEDEDEDEDALPVMESTSIHEYSEYVPDEEILPLVMSHDVGEPGSIRLQQGKRKVLGLVLLISGLVALIIYVFLPMVMAASNTGPNVSDKEQVAIPQITSIATVPIPAQVAIVPTVQPSVQTTAMPTQPPGPKGKSISSSYVRSKPLAPPKPTPTPTVTDAPINYEAEASQNTLTGGAEVISCSGCSGGYRVGYLGLRPNGNDGTLQFNNVKKVDAGSYTLTLYYSNGASSDEDEYISINSGAAIVFDGSPTGSSTTFATAGIAVNLNAGSNTIKFYNSQGDAPDIDRIVV